MSADTCHASTGVCEASLCIGVNRKTPCSLICTCNRFNSQCARFVFTPHLASTGQAGCRWQASLQQTPRLHASCRGSLEASVRNSMSGSVSQPKRPHSRVNQSGCKSHQVPSSIHDQPAHSHNATDIILVAAPCIGHFQGPIKVDKSKIRSSANNLFFKCENLYGRMLKGLLEAC